MMTSVTTVASSISCHVGVCEVVCTHVLQSIGDVAIATCLNLVVVSRHLSPEVYNVIELCADKTGSTRTNKAAGRLSRKGRTV